MRTAVYARFSSDDQRPESIRDQVRNCSAHASRLGWDAPVVYSDEAVSGSVRERAGYQRMLSDAREHAFDVLLVDDLSRLSRDQVETAQTVRLLRYHGIRMVGVCDGVDTERKGHKLEVGLRGLMSEMYLDDLADKTHRGLSGQALAGFSAGGLPYGYCSVEAAGGHSRAIDPDKAEVVRLVFARYADGHSPRAIADELNRAGVPSPRGGTWAHSAIYGDMRRGIGLLNNAVYIGQQVWNRSQWVKDPVTGTRKRRERPETEWIITEHEELRIIDQQTWNRVKARQKDVRSRSVKMQNAARRVAREGRGPKYIFSGLLECAECGGRFVVVDRYRYGCSRHRDRGPTACSNNLRVTRKVVEETLLATIKQDLLSEEAYQLFAEEVRDLLKAARPDPSAARKRLREAEAERDNVMSAIRQGIITPSTKQALTDAEGAVREAEKALEEMESFEPTQILPRAREVYRRLVTRLEAVEDVPAAREAIKEITGPIRLVPENGILVAELTAEGLGSQFALVAGAGYSRKLTPSEPMRVPLVPEKSEPR